MIEELCKIVRVVSPGHTTEMIDKIERCPVCNTIMRRNGDSDTSMTMTTAGKTGERTITCCRCDYTELSDHALLRAQLEPLVVWGFTAESVKEVFDELQDQDNR